MNTRKPCRDCIAKEEEITEGGFDKKLAGAGSGGLDGKENIGSAEMSGYENFEWMPKRERYEKAFSDKAGAEFYRRFFILER